MGAEANCRVWLNQSESFGKAHCGDGEIDFRGDFRFRWKWSDLSYVEAQNGELTLRCGGDQVTFELGPLAEKWCYAILHPKTRLDKLGLKSGQDYQLLGQFEDDFRIELIQAVGEPSNGLVDVMFVRMNAIDELALLLEARSRIHPNGMVWAVWAKGRKEFSENHIREFCLQNGLVDVKVARFSEALSALKFVIPVKDRA